MSKKIQLAHGGGGRLSHELIEDEIVSRFGGGALKGLPDAAALKLAADRILFSTDSFVVQPIFFPGGSIGDLAVHGTVNDIAACGGRPRWISLAMIIEEGFEREQLGAVLDAVKAAAERCSVQIATGDTKVVPRGEADGLYLNTAGIGEALPGFELDAARIVPGDLVLASGGLAEHGMAVMAARNGLNLSKGPVSDTGPVHRLVLALEELAGEVRFMRDPTRGGAAAVLNEVTAGRRFGIEIEESAIPLNGGVKAVCELLGFDPLHVPSEGRLLAVCSAAAADAMLRRWQSLPEGSGAVCLGRATAEAGQVVLCTNTGGRRLIDWPQGELLPRIC